MTGCDKARRGATECNGVRQSAGGVQKVQWVPMMVGARGQRIGGWISNVDSAMCHMAYLGCGGMRQVAGGCQREWWV